MTTFLKCISDGWVQVRDEQGKLLGAVEMALASTATIITTSEGAIFQLGMIGMSGILCREDQDPSIIPGFMAWGDGKPTQSVPVDAEGDPTV